MTNESRRVDEGLGRWETVPGDPHGAMIYDDGHGNRGLIGPVGVTGTIGPIGCVGATGPLDALSALTRRPNAIGVTGLTGRPGPTGTPSRTVLGGLAQLEGLARQLDHVMAAMEAFASPYVGSPKGVRGAVGADGHLPPRTPQDRMSAVVDRFSAMVPALLDLVSAVKAGHG